MNNAESLALLGRVMGGLLVVLVLIGLAARVARRTRGSTGTSGLRVVDRVGLSREASLAVIEVSDRLLLLGVTAQGVTMLADLDEIPETERVLSESAAEPRLLAQPEPELSEFEPQLPKEPVHEDDEPPTPQRALPTGIALDQYPDLASALRAAGRTTDTAGPAPVKPAPVGGSDLVISSQLAVPDGSGAASRPRTRAEARAEARALARANAGLAPAKASGRSRIPLPRNPNDPTDQASGSVLSPKTWRQGIEALRDLTVRRG